MQGIIKAFRRPHRFARCRFAHATGTAASQGFRPPIAFRRGPWLAMPRIAAPCTPGRKPWEVVSMGYYQRSLV